MAINDYFNQFIENIKLTSKQIEDAKTKYNGVCGKLHNHYYSTQYSGSTKLLIGSYGKKTNIRPARDIDVIFMMPPEKFDQYDDNQSNGQAQLLQDIKRILEEKYPNTPIKAFGKVVVLEFADTKHNVELLPAWENTDGTFTIPNSESGGFWEQWDPRAEIEKIKDSDAKTGRSRTLVRMIKKWTECCSIKMKSYLIENKVVDYFGDQAFSEKEYPVLVRDFYEYFSQTETNNDIKSHVDSALNRAKKACVFEADDKPNSAVEEWRKIFGDDFPANLQKSVSLINEEKPALADYSHFEALKWSYTGESKVSIDAYIYNQSKTTKLGGINSDGRNIPKHLSLKYIAKTNTAGNFQYFWQVVNTGQEASSANGLRGKIFSGSQGQWENTLYQGKHWVECFIVQNEVCVARSGKFFINIK